MEKYARCPLGNREGQREVVQVTTDERRSSEGRAGNTTRKGISTSSGPISIFVCEGRF